MKGKIIILVAVLAIVLSSIACDDGDPTPQPSTNCNNPQGCDIFYDPELLQKMREVCEAMGGHHEWIGDRVVCRR